MHGDNGILFGISGYESLRIASQIHHEIYKLDTNLNDYQIYASHQSKITKYNYAISLNTLNSIPFHQKFLMSFSVCDSPSLMTFSSQFLDKSKPLVIRNT